MIERAPTELVHINGLDSLVINVVNGWGDKTSIMGQAGRVAEGLGYLPGESATFAWGDETGQAYQPGLISYTPEQHVRGVASTILDAPSPLLPAHVKAQLLDHVANAASRSSYDQDWRDPSRPKPLRQGTVRRAIMRETWSRTNLGNIANHGPNQLRSICVASDVYSQLRREWYPYRRPVIAAAVGVVGTAAGLLARKHAS